MALILIIEDNELNRTLVSRRLSKRGFEVVEVCDAEQGKAEIARQKPDLIVMDLGLPGVDGWELTRRLKASPETFEIPILVLTAYARSADSKQALDAGCDAFETKPLNFESFLSKIHKLLSDRAVGLPEARS